MEDLGVKMKYIEKCRMWAFLKRPCNEFGLFCELEGFLLDRQEDIISSKECDSSRSL